MKQRSRDKGKERNRSVRAKPSEQLRIHPRAASTLDQCRATEVLGSLKSVFETATSISAELNDCTNFTLLALDELHELGNADALLQAGWFWHDVNLLLVLLARTNARTIQGLIDSLSWAFGSRNELQLALSTRSFLEHAAALAYLQDSLFGITKKLQGVVWPNLGTNDPRLIVEKSDLDVRNTLVRFAVGRVAEIVGEHILSDSDSFDTWKQFQAGMRQVSPHLKSLRVGEMRSALVNVRGRQILGPIYELLCEYCHPNSASRNVEFQVDTNRQGKHRLVVGKATETSVGFNRLMGICRVAVPRICDAAREGLIALRECIMPMAAETFGGFEPKPYSHRTVDPHGRVSWVEEHEIARIPPQVRAVLTPEQELRIQALAQKFERAAPNSLEKWRYDMSCEGPFLEEELAHFEHLARVFQQELKERGPISDEDCVRLYLALIKSMEAASVDELISIFPPCRHLSALERVLKRVQHRAAIEEAPSR
jgi:transposase-like protein